MARPNLSYLKNMLLFLFGLPCGLLAGLTGMGASVTASPLLRYLLGLRGSRLSGVALTVTFFAALSALLSFAQHGYVHWFDALLFVVGQTIGAMAARRLTARVPKLASMLWLWAALVVGIGLHMCADALGIRHLIVPHLPGALFHYAALLALSVLAGIVTGIVALGWVLTVPAAIYGLGFTVQAAEGTAIVVLLLASLPVMLARAARQDLEPASSTWMSSGAIFGGLVGAFYAVSPGLTTQHLTLIYGIVLTLLGVSLLWRTGEDGAETSSSPRVL